MTRTPILPALIEDTVAAIAAVQTEHIRRAGPMQRAVTSATAAFARPAFVFALTAAVFGWVALNLILLAAGRAAPDPPPFNYLFGAVSVAALYLAAFILITQRNDDEVFAHREQLTLELAIQSERKSAKIIELLETLRINDPNQSSRPDAEAQLLARPADPEAVLKAYRATQAETE